MQVAENEGHTDTAEPGPEAGGEDQSPAWCCVCLLSCLPLAPSILSQHHPYPSSQQRAPLALANLGGEGAQMQPGLICAVLHCLSNALARSWRQFIIVYPQNSYCLCQIMSGENHLSFLLGPFLLCFSGR